MAKQSADDFFKSMKGSGSTATESADDFFERVQKEQSGQIETRETVNSKLALKEKSLEPQIAEKTPYTVDFKADQAKKKEAASPLEGKVPAASLLTGSSPSTLQTNLKDKVPVASLLNETGGGPANASQIPGISQYEINKKYIDENANPIVKPYSNAMNYIMEGNPIGVAASNAFSGNSGVTRKDSSGNATVDKISDTINNLVTPFITPTGAPLGQGIIGSTYNSTAKILNTKPVMKYTDYLANSLINRGLIPAASKGAAEKVAKSIITETIAGAPQGAAFGVMQGQDSGEEIIKNAQLGAATGGLLAGGGSIVSEAFPSLLSRFRKSGIADDEIAEIAPELLALPEAQPRTIRKQQAGEIKTTPSGEPIATPYTFKIGEATPETQAATANRQSLRSTDPAELNTRYAQEVIDEYKTLKQSPKKMSNKKLYDLARDNVDARRPVDATTVESKLKDTRINGEAAPYKESVIRDPQTVSREQAIVNKGKNITQEDIDFAMSDKWDNAKLFPESVPTKSTYVKPTPKPVAEVKPTIKTAAKVEGAKPAAKKSAIVTEVKTSVKSLTDAKKKATPGIRANFKTMTDSKAISSTLKGKIAKLDQKYEVLKNAEVIAKSDAAMKDISKVESEFLASGSTGAQHISNGYRAMQELDKAGEHARALAIADKLAKDLTEAGQTVQAASLISRLSPEGQLLNLIRTAERNGKVVELADKVKFTELAAKVQENTGAGKTENAIADILNRLEQGGANADDIKALGDYLKTAESKVKPKVVKDRLPKELDNARKRDKVVSFLEAQEAAAQARINKRRGRINSLPVEEWIDYSIIISAKVAKGVIKAETYVEDLVKLFGEDIKPLATQIFEKAQQLVSSVTKGSIEGDFIKADNAFKRITGKGSLNQQERIVEKYVAANPKVTPRDIESLRTLSKSLTELQGTDKIKADMAMQKILNSYEKSSVMDKVNALRYIAMLYNSGTQLINAASGPIMATTGRVADVFGTMIDTTLSAAMKQPKTTTLYGGNPVKFMAEYFKGLKVGAKAGWEGVNPAGIQGANEIRGLTYKSLYNPLSLLERSLGAVAKGADYAAYTAIHGGEMEKQGFLDALENGIKRSNKEAIKRHIRKFVNDPTEAALEQADRIAKNATFQRNDTLGGQTANFLSSTKGFKKVDKYVSPAIRTVFPFVRTPVNIASTAFTISPGGVLKGLIQLAFSKNVTQREAIRTLSLGLTGTGLSAMGYYLNQLGIITGANDSGDKNVNSIREQAGKGKYRFNTSALQRYVGALLDGEGAEAAESAAKYQKGDKAFDYNKLQPLAFPLAIGAQFKELNGRSATQRVAGTVQGAAGSLFGMSTLRGVQDVFQPQYDEGTQGDKTTGIVSRLAESFFKSFSPSMLAQEARRQDPTVRKTPYNNGIVADVKGYYQSRTPGLSKGLLASKDTLGQNKLNAPGIKGQYLNPYKSEVANYTQAAQLISDLMDRTGDMSLAPKPPEKKVTGRDENDDSITLDIKPKRYEQMQKDVGDEIISRIMEIEAGTDEEIATQIHEIYADVRKEKMDELREELGI